LGWVGKRVWPVANILWAPPPGARGSIRALEQFPVPRLLPDGPTFVGQHGCWHGPVTYKTVADDLLLQGAQHYRAALTAAATDSRRTDRSRAIVGQLTCEGADDAGSGGPDWMA
jgi:hypothetical protein